MFFLTFFRLSLNFALRSSWSEPQSALSYFCCLYRASLSLAAKNITNLIPILTIWWCPYVELSRVVWRGGGLTSSVKLIVMYIPWGRTRILFSSLHYFLIASLCLFVFFCLFFTIFYFTILYWFCHTLTWIHHGCKKPK